MMTEKLTLEEITETLMVLETKKENNPDALTPEDWQVYRRLKLICEHVYEVNRRSKVPISFNFNRGRQGRDYNIVWESYL